MNPITFFSRKPLNNNLMMFAILLLLMPLVQASAEAGDNETKFAIEIEAGPVWQSRNDVQIPNTEEGTRFSLVDLVGNGPYPGARLYFTWNISQRHGVRLLAAPLAYTEGGEFTLPVNFAGEVFDAGVPTDGTYKFNSWRITYRYQFYRGAAWNWWIGFTAKIRDAKIQLEQPGKSAQKTDVGFVPLLHLRGEFHFAKRWQIALDADALAGGPGRAIDAALKFGYELCDRWNLSGGYRTVEGGADVEEVYNFAWLHYAVLSVEYKF